MSLRSRAVNGFRARFGQEPEVVVRAPGRVNLLGGHTDYNQGFVLPVAVDRAAWVAAASTPGPTVTVRALDLDDEVDFPLDHLPRRGSGGWADYPKGVAWALRERGLELVGMQALLTSDVPVGAGLSSSAAIEVAFAYAWQLLSDFDLDSRELALTCQRAENEYVGVNCGIMDQMTSVLGRAGHALLLDCRTLEVKPMPLPQGVAIVVADTGVRRELAASEYNLRRAQCEEAVQRLAAHLPGLTALRDLTLADFERFQHHLPPVVRCRARHVVTENGRVLAAAEALPAGDVATVGQLMREAHTSLRDDYEVSSPELDRLAEAAWGMEGCWGARLTGAGFGGCVVALVDACAVERFEAGVSAAYKATFDRPPTVYACRSADGVGQV